VDEAVYAEGMPTQIWFLSIAAFTIVGTLLGFLISSVAFRQIQIVVPRVESLPVQDKIAGVIGIILGLAVAFLLQPLVSKINLGGIGPLLVFVVYLVAVALGAVFMLSMKKELFAMLHVSREEAVEEEPREVVKPKLLDTNIIIEGRILDVCRTGFVEGPLLVPQFVLDELHQIADSSDALRRARGRRGLDILNQMKDELGTFAVWDPPYGVEFEESEGVDSKLIKLAASCGASVLTNDFNLTKIAELQGIKVLNINKLATALKPVVLPGEQMTVTVIKEGKEDEQGVAYLEDGTMVVIEEGRRYIDQPIDVVVTSVLQTHAGKMIFANARGRTASRSHR